MNAIIDRPATESDAPALAAFFAETFRETFGHLYQPADLAAFLADQTARDWQDQLRDEALSIRVATQDETVVGFAKLGPLKLPVTPDGPALEIRQLYVAPHVRGSGVAVTLMHWLIDAARTQGAATVYLSVYTDNKRAQAFYTRFGFVDIGPCTFMVGTQADEDRIMRASLT